MRHRSMFRRLCVYAGMVALGLTLGFPAMAESQPVPVHWRLGDDMTITSIDLLVAPLAGPPIAGFVPYLAEVLTNEFIPGEEDLFHVLADVPGTPSPVLPSATDFAVSVFDTGAVTHLVNYCDSQTLGLTGSFLIMSTIPIQGVVGEIIANVSDPIGFYVDGLSAVDSGTGVLDSTGMIGHWNVAGVSAPFENCADGPEIPSVIGTIFSAFYMTHIRNDTPITRTINSTVYESPDIEFFFYPSGSNPSPPAPPSYPHRIPLQLLPSAVGAIYVPEIEFGGEVLLPAVPTTLTGASNGSLFFAGVHLTHGAWSAPARLFMVDTGAQVSVISTFTAGLLGLDPNNPDFTVDIEGIGGSLTDVPGFNLDFLSVGALGGLLEYTDAPVVMLDVPSPDGGLLDGILGMNLFADRNILFAGDLTSPYMEVSDILPAAPTTVAADTDDDGDVDGVDFAKFANCFNKAGNPPRTIGCDAATGMRLDFDDDGDIDGVDFAKFANCFNKAGNPPRTLGCP